MAPATPDTTSPVLDAVFAALSNPTRRTLIERLGVGDATISELADPLDMTLPAVSKHLQVLEHAGLVTRTKEGAARRCALQPDGLLEVESWIATRRAFWSATLDALADHFDGNGNGDGDGSGEAQ